MNFIEELIQETRLPYKEMQGLIKKKIETDSELTDEDKLRLANLYQTATRKFYEYAKDPLIVVSFTDIISGASPVHKQGASKLKIDRGVGKEDQEFHINPESEAGPREPSERDEHGTHISNPRNQFTQGSQYKLGLNPKSRFNTPNGIYVYPLHAYMNGIKAYFSDIANNPDPHPSLGALEHQTHKFMAKLSPIDKNRIANAAGTKDFENEVEQAVTTSLIQHFFPFATQNRYLYFVKLLRTHEKAKRGRAVERAMDKHNLSSLDDSSISKLARQISPTSDAVIGIDKSSTHTVHRGYIEDLGNPSSYTREMFVADVVILDHWFEETYGYSGFVPQLMFRMLRGQSLRKLERVDWKDIIKNAHIPMGPVLWGLTRLLSCVKNYGRKDELMDNVTATYNALFDGANGTMIDPNVWNKLLSKVLGYSWVLDQTSPKSNKFLPDDRVPVGSGIIHKAEPTQGVIFDPLSYKIVDLMHIKDPNSESTNTEGHEISRYTDESFTENNDVLSIASKVMTAIHMFKGDKFHTEDEAEELIEVAIDKVKHELFPANTARLQWRLMVRKYTSGGNFMSSLFANIDKIKTELATNKWNPCLYYTVLDTVFGMDDMEEELGKINQFKALILPLNDLLSPANFELDVDASPFKQTLNNSTPMYDNTLNYTAGFKTASSEVKSLICLLASQPATTRPNEMPRKYPSDIIPRIEAMTAYWSAHPAPSGLKEVLRQIVLHQIPNVDMDFKEKIVKLVKTVTR